MVSDRGGQLILLPGDDHPDLELMSLSSWPLDQVDRLWQYFREGGQENIQRALEFIGHYGCGWGQPPPPKDSPLGQLSDCGADSQRLAAGGDSLLPCPLLSGQYGGD